MNESSVIVQRLWSYCNILRDDGVSYGDYVEQLTYLIFLKMADEQKKQIIPKCYDWKTLLNKEGNELESHYRTILNDLGKKEGMLGAIFRKSQTKIQDPVKLKRLIDLINAETWIGLDIDVKGEIYEGLLQKNAEDVKSGSGQYFTPRPLIKAIVEVMKPEPGMTICDPACGTGGFILAAYEYINSKYKLSKAQKIQLITKTFKGWEIVDNTARLCVMNLYLHGITGEESPINVGDALISDPLLKFDMILSNPPFGKKSMITIINDEGRVEKDTLAYTRTDFWTTTSNKQLNFIQHIVATLDKGGRAAVVVPDNVLFESGAGEIIRKMLLTECSLHTMLRLPAGIFYAQGVKANVIFFSKKDKEYLPYSEKLWVYDLRTNMHFTLKNNQIKYEDLKDFINAYNPQNIYERLESERFRAFTYEELKRRDKVNLDICWLDDNSKEESERSYEPKTLVNEIIENLQLALEQFNHIYNELEKP